jgi:DHA1 family bicyclomycin/chloramphenicol resistance-like MFS transporter
MAHFAALAGTASALLGTFQFGLGGLAGAVLGNWHDASGLPMAVVILGCILMANLAWRR